ncbi:MAG: hypothetical protein IPL83_01400 [Bdellovibrionales bacterium]|nr:hypothetical protein [Bdellovibrionales bacterium]
MAVAWGWIAGTGYARRFRASVVACRPCGSLVALNTLCIYLRREQGGKVEVSIWWVLIAFIVGLGFGFEDSISKKQKKKKQDTDDE